MENIENELDNKSIERDETPLPAAADAEPKKRTKKERSPAQIAAFEKARKKRAENLALKKEAKNKEPSPEAKNIIDNWKNIVDEEPPPRKPIKTQSTRKQALKSVEEYHDYPQQQKQPIINNYYYGTNNHEHIGKETKQKKSRKKKVPVEVSSSDSEGEVYTDDDDEDYTPPPAKPKKQIQRKTTFKEPAKESEEPRRLQFNFV
jgi:hypothetical protein